MTSEELYQLIHDDIAAALQISDHSIRMTALRAAGDAAFRVAYDDVPGDPKGVDQASIDFLNVLNAAMAMTYPDGTDDQVDRVARVWAIAAANGAHYYSAPKADKRWITMADDRVRDVHVPMHGVSVQAGQSFVVGGIPMRYPGEPVGPPEHWINCRCTLDTSNVVAAASTPEQHQSGVIVARPTDPTALAVPDGEKPEDLHVTLGFYGPVDDAPEGLRELLSQWVEGQPAAGAANVSGVGRIGFDDPQAVVLLVESPVLQELRDSLAMTAPPDATHPHFTPHMTLGYGIDMPTETPETVELGAPELWWGEERTGGDMEPLETIESEAAAADEPDDLEARAFDTKKRKAMAKRHTAMPDGSFPIANAEDLHNAIQAIGRAKDPDKVRAHIRRRAKALGLESQLPDSWSASATADGMTAWAPSTSPPGTHDAPGWLTHPRETQRLRTYWVKGPGAAKIGWGTPNDLTRCHRNLQKYVGPYAWATCQNMHKEALGYWNPESRGRRGGGDLPDEMIDMVDAAFTAAAELEDDMPEMLAPPAEWFADPGFDGPTPLTITSDGRVLGHLASWDTCHVGISGECVKPPHSKTAYAHFRTGEVETREGELVAVGQITMDTGHADKGEGPQATVAHYDNTGTGVADVNAGEDEYGIWVAGAMRPGVSEQQMYVLKATGALSGDWRRIGGNLELVAALAVNVPGFPIPRVAMAASVSGQELSLVAAAVVTSDPNAGDVDRIAIAVTRALDEREAKQVRAARASALTATLSAARAQRLLEIAAGKIPPQFLKQVKANKAKGEAPADDAADEDPCGEQREGESDEDYAIRMAECEEAEDAAPKKKVPAFAR